MTDHTPVRRSPRIAFVDERDAPRQSQGTISRTKAGVLERPGKPRVDYFVDKRPGEDDSRCTAFAYAKLDRGFMMGATVVFAATSCRFVDVGPNGKIVSSNWKGYAKVSYEFPPTIPEERLPKGTRVDVAKKTHGCFLGGKHRDPLYGVVFSWTSDEEDGERGMDWAVERTEELIEAIKRIAGRKDV